MATIISAYDLSGGDTTSTAIATPNNVRLQFEVTGATSEQQVAFATLQVNDGTAYVDMADKDGRLVKYPIAGNVKFSKNHFGINSATMQVVIDATDCDGSLTVTSYES